VSFEVRTTIPALSVQVARRLLNMVNTFDVERRQTQARAERDFLEDRLARADSALRAAEEELSRFYRGNREFSNSPSLRAEEARLLRQVDLRQQLFVTLAQNREAARIEELRSTPVITVLERPEPFVEPAARGTVSKTIVAFVAMGLLATGMAFLLEHLSRARETGSDEYQAFAEAARDVREGLLAPMRRGARTAS
jgi:uncharacterized protein involved in exopolysaccharide biosynthesis